MQTLFLMMNGRRPAFGGGRPIFSPEPVLDPEPGVGLGEDLANLGVIEHVADLLERAPAMPVARRIFQMLGRAGERRLVLNLGEEVGDGLDHLAPAAYVGVRQAPLEPFAD